MSSTTKDQLKEYLVAQEQTIHQQNKELEDLELRLEIIRKQLAENRANRQTFKATSEITVGTGATTANNEQNWTN